ncbi:MAG TPA: aspartate kinase [Thermoanaerobaculia bacterium]|nr:aspartate kinase [Thermoanaerobaculia bacterium]
MIVLKFGGSSVDGAAGIARAAAIVRERLAKEPVVVVVSAMAKATRLLRDCAEEAAAGILSSSLASCASLHDFHRREAEAAVPAAARPALAAALERSFGELRALLARLAAARQLTPRDADHAVAFGELLASEILALALPRHGVDAAWVDCRQVMVTDDGFTCAQPLYEETDARLRARLLPLLAQGKVPVLGGYVGATAAGITTTLGTEGSDFSAAIVGAALGVREVQIWTDVDGILTADPRLVPGALLVPTLSFAESLELACAGAKKPHPGTLGPAGRAGIPIRILNSRRPPSETGEGTLIGRRSAAAPAVRSLAFRANDRLLYALPATRGGSDGFLAGVLAAAERLRPALLVVEAGAERALLALDREERLGAVRAALAPLADVGVVRGRAVVSLVSDDLAASPQLVERALAAAGDYQPRLVVAGAAAPAVRCLVEVEELPVAVAAIHRRLFAPLAPLAPIDAPAASPREAGE